MLLWEIRFWRRNCLHSDAKLHQYWYFLWFQLLWIVSNHCQWACRLSHANFFESINRSAVRFLNQHQRLLSLSVIIHGFVVLKRRNGNLLNPFYFHGKPDAFAFVVHAIGRIGWMPHRSLPSYHANCPFCDESHDTDLNIATVLWYSCNLQRRSFPLASWSVPMLCWTMGAIR